MQATLKESDSRTQSPRRTSQRSLNKCQQFLVLKKFEEAVTHTCEALLGPSNDLNENSLDGCLSRLGSLSQKQFHQKFDPTPYIIILVQSLFSLDFQFEKQGKESRYYQTVLQFLSNFYGRVDRFPFDVVFICVNLLVMGKHFREAKSMLHYSLEIDTSFPLSSPSRSSSKTVLNTEQTEKLIQIYIFHVLPNLDQIPEGLAYLETPVDGDYENQSSETKNPLELLPKWKRQAFKEQLNKLLEESNREKENKKVTLESENKFGQPSIENKTEQITKPPETSRSTKENERELSKKVGISDSWKMITNYLQKHQNSILLVLSLLGILGTLLKYQSRPKQIQPKRFKGRNQSRSFTPIPSSSGSSFFSGIAQLFSAFFSYSGKPIV